MSSHTFIFEADKATNSVHMVRAFAAPLHMVWEAFTNPEILDQWGAPEPYTMKTKYMNFHVGGRRVYSMNSPEGQQFWSVQDYTAIKPMVNIQYISGFTDNDENINPEFYGSENNLDFSEENGITTVRISIRYKTPSILEMMVSRGFKEGSAASFNNLEMVLKGQPTIHD